MEILVVIAISAVLFALLLGPLVNSFRLTQRAQMLAAAQDQARIRIENLTRELGSASYVFDNTTHPFSGSSSTVNAAIPNLHFTNFLVFETPKNVNNTVTMVPAAVFNAKLDFVLPRHANPVNANGQPTYPIDPTTGQPIIIKANGTVGPTGLTYPLAPDTNMIRYFVGLRDPTKPYATHGEGPLLATGDNTYVMFRAQFNPSAVNPTTGLPEKNSDGSTVDEQLFTPKLDSSGNVTNTPEFDDPDFFRYVTVSDINWLDPNHANYTSADVTAHNARVDKWAQIAKPIINIANVDLILLPHNSDNSIAYDAGGQFQNISHSGAVHDPVTGTDWPVVNSSVTFRPAAVSADATASTTSDYSGAGYGGNVAAANNGLPYVPTVYTATDQSWAFPYHISLYQYNNTTSALYDTTVATVTDTSGMYQAGDLLEQMYSNNSQDLGTPIYDVTSGLPLVSNGQYVPMTVTPDTGTISFDLPALPFPATAASPGQPYQRYWSLLTVDANGQKSPFDNGQPCSNGIINLADNTLLANTPLPVVASLGNEANGNAPAASPDAVQNARLVPGSLHVYGPDGTPGPDLGQSVLYTEVTPGSASFGPNEYTVDYTTNSLTLYIDPATGQLPMPTSGTAANVSIAFDYQANLAPDTAGSAISAADPADPLRVKVDYQTRDLLDINLGVRVYDPNNVGQAQIVTVHNQVRIGNSNR